MPETCGSCHAPIYWALTPAGARAPVDLNPDREKGNVLLLRPSSFGATLAVTLSKDTLKIARDNRVPLRTNHYAVCPDREEWRRRTDAARAAGPT